MKMMSLTHIVIFLCLVIYSSSQDTSAEDTYTADEVTIIELSNSSLENNGTEIFTDSYESTLSSTLNSENPTEGTTEIVEVTFAETVDTVHDKIITGTSPPDVETEKISDGTTTIAHDEFENISIATTTVKEEVQPVCSLNPCKNGGTCVEDDAIPSLFSCICPPGFVGIRCGTVDRCGTGEEEDLCKTGACMYSENGLRRSCQCFDGKYWDDEAKGCRDPDPPCFPNPCMNGGACFSDDDDYYCRCPTGYTGKNCSVLEKCGECNNGTCELDKKGTTKYCKCDDGLYWNGERERCEDMTSACVFNPCENGGSCNAISDADFNCTCSEGFSGETCKTVDICSGDGDCGLGSCVLSEDGKTRSCECNKGTYLDEFSLTCKEITNVCQPNPCLNDGICLATSSTAYTCHCSDGFTGKNCDVRNLCYMDGGIRFCGNGTCENHFDLGLFYCTCNETEYFRYKERTCTGLNSCPLMQCGTNEKCSLNKCICEDNYAMDDTNACKANFCASNPCPLKDMKCEEGSGKTDFKCSCNEGYAFNGTHCNEAICTFPSLNLCNQYCSEKSGEYECNCVEDFELTEDNHTCAYTGNNTCSNKTCDNGFCVMKDGAEVCICPPGFTEDNGICKDVCTTGHLKKGICPLDQCEATSGGGIRCKCDGKLVLSKDKTTCMVRNICQENESGWKTCKEKNAVCVVDWTTTPGFRCTCAAGELLVEGVCREICSIEDNQKNCSINGASCGLDSERNLICSCPPYFKTNEDGKCTEPADFSYLITLPLDKATYAKSNRKRSLDATIDYWKISADVSITMQDMFTSFEKANILSCKSVSDYTLCKIELQFSRQSEKELKLLKSEDICLSHGNSNKCLLPPALVLVKKRIIDSVSIQPTDPCDEDVTDVVCGSETTCVSSLPQKSFNCSCKNGYFPRMKNYPFGNARSFIELCSDTDECALGDPCPANSNCANTVGSYTCSCKTGYRSSKDTFGNEMCVAICNPNPCVHGQCLTRGDHEFECRCDAGYSGFLCNLQDERLKKAKINTIIVGVVLGGALLITFILFAACISRIRKKNAIENPDQIFYSTTEMAERRRGPGGAVNNAFQRE